MSAPLAASARAAGLVASLAGVVLALAWGALSPPAVAAQTAASSAATARPATSSAASPAAARAPAGIDVNVATADELQTVRGIGPALAARILEERARGPYRDLADLEARVKGVGPANARRFAEAGLVVGAGRGRVGPAAAPAAGPVAGAPTGGPPDAGVRVVTTTLGAGVVREYQRPSDGALAR